MNETSAVSYIKVEVCSESGVANSQAPDDQAGETWRFQVIQTMAAHVLPRNVPVDYRILGVSQESRISPLSDVFQARRVG